MWCFGLQTGPSPGCIGIQASDVLAEDTLSGLLPPGGPQVPCGMRQSIFQSPMNVRLVEFDLVLLLLEMNSAGNDATDKSGQKYNNGFQHFTRSQKHFHPAPADVGSLNQRHSNTPGRSPEPNHGSAFFYRNGIPFEPHPTTFPPCGFGGQKRPPGKWLDKHTFALGSPIQHAMEIPILYLNQEKLSD